MASGRSRKPGYAGHMAKAAGGLGDAARRVDVILVMLDARAPGVCFEPFAGLGTLSQRKSSTLIMLGRDDLADPEATAKWLEKFRNDGYAAVSVNSKDRGSVKSALRTAVALRAPSRKKIYSPRAMLLGVPNTGKSTFINTAAGSRKARVADTAGVTRGEQWVSADGIELLDMPGILDPGKVGPESTLLLGCIGAFSDADLDAGEAANLIFEKTGTERFLSAYGISPEGIEDCAGAIEALAERNGMILRGGEPDVERAALTAVRDYRKLRFGRISLEEPDD
ncbi:MAG: GTPase [Oscillospiraceae bacterium]|jgi:ribosome biogenesis GTPase A